MKGGRVIRALGDWKSEVVVITYNGITDRNITRSAPITSRVQAKAGAEKLPLVVT